MKYKISSFMLLVSSSLLAQQNPTGPAGPSSVPLNLPAVRNAVEQAWYRGGNFPTGSGGNKNIFGTLWNSPIYTQTNGKTHTRLNGDLVTPINGVNQNVSGYFGISHNPASAASFFDTNSPWAMLHLDGPNNTVFLAGMWRSWMRTGLYMRENSDAMYVGLKQEAGTNRSDAVINWSDDAGAGEVDKLRFLFTGSATGNGNGTDPHNGASFSGYEFMRMQSFSGISNSAGYPVGHVGIGPMFTDALPPQNRLHMNAEDNLANFLQISNEGGTGQTGSDGLHIGYPITAPTFLTAHINQKENDNMLLLTNSGERIRVSHIGNISTPNMNPGGLSNNITRVSISHDPTNPVTKPLSLLHLGYNTGIASFPSGSTDGWRSWMDIGMFTSNGTDNIYLGLKNESNLSIDRQDAVLSWGDNQTSGLLDNGPDNFRFIFTSTTTGSGGTPPATSVDGLEALRMTPTSANGVFTGIGGDPSVNLYSAGTQTANNTLEINSWGATTVAGGSSGLRFTNLTSTATPTITNPGNGVLSVDDKGDVIYVEGGGCKTTIVSTSAATTTDCATGGVKLEYGIDANCDGILQASETNTSLTQYVCNGSTGAPGAPGAPGPAGGVVNANNGLSIVSSSLAVLGQNVGQATNPGRLINNREIPLFGNDLILNMTNSGNFIVGNSTANIMNTGSNSVFGDGNSFLTGSGSTFGANFVSGNNNIIDHRSIKVFGSSNDVKGQGDFVIGSNNKVNVNNTGNSNIIIGGTNQVDGIRNNAIGFDNRIINDPSNTNSPIESYILGNRNFAYGDGSIVIGNKVVSAPSGGMVHIGNHTGPSTSALNLYFTNNPGLSGAQNAHLDPAISANGYIPAINIGDNNKIGIKKYAPAFALDVSGEIHADNRISSVSNKTAGNIAGQFEALNPSGSNGNIGVYGKATSSGSATNYAGYFEASGSTNLNYAGYFNGDVYISGSYGPSDNKLKKDVDSITNALGVIKQLQPKTFEYKHSDFPSMSLPKGVQYGFIAQEVEQILPALVTNNTQPAVLDTAGTELIPEVNFKGLEYQQLIPFLVKAIQEQQHKIDSLTTKLNTKDSIQDARLTALETAIDRCCSNTGARTNATTTNQVDVELSDKDAIVLDQNVPNPFAEQTSITYNVPTSVAKAQLIFYNSNGQIIQTVDIKTRGKGKVNVFASDLSTGLYHYTLVADGKVVDSKKMVRE